MATRISDKYRGPTRGGSSPWGRIQEVTPIAGGAAAFVSTPSHGGLWLSPTLWRCLPEIARETPYSRGGWFEEDSDVAIPIAFLPELGILGEDKVTRARELILRPNYYLPAVAAALEGVTA